MTRRTTLAADADDLRVLQDEARRRGVSLARVLRELVAKEAAEVRARRPKPRIGIFDSGGAGLSELSWRDEESPARGRLRS